MDENIASRRLSAPVAGIQINCCRNSLCPQFGVPPTVRFDGKRGERWEGYLRTGGAGARSLTCGACGEASLLKSNRAAFEELTRHRAYLDELPLVRCVNPKCSTRTSDEGSSFQKFGTTRSGSPRVRCKTCGKTQSFPSEPTWRQKADDKNELILRLLVNKVAMRRILEVADISPQTLYRKIGFFEQQCLRFAARFEQTLSDKKFEHLQLASDQQSYLINWGSHLLRRSFALRAVATAECRSGYVLGIHPNFDPSLSAVEIEKAARACGDIDLEPIDRKFARVWLVTDYSNAARRNARRSHRDGESRGENQPELSTPFEVNDPFLEDYEHTAPSRGVQVRQEYVLFGHFLFLHSQLRSAKRLTLFLDPDAGLRTAALGGFCDRIRDQQVDVFLVRAAKVLTVDRRDLALAKAEQRFQRFCERDPSWTRWQAGEVWLRERFAEWLSQPGTERAWITHPFPDRVEPDKEVCLLTRRQDSEAKLIAPLAMNAGLKSIDRFFMLIRRRISLLERSLKTAASASRACYAYAPYSPAVACSILNVFRVVYNFHLGEKDNATPAMRLGIAERRFGLDEILATPRPSRITRRGTDTVLQS